MTRAVELPELGENVQQAEVLAVMVTVGSRVSMDQTLIEVETDKAAVEVPSPVAGVVTAISVKPGDAVRVGQVIVEIDTEAEGAGKEPARKPGFETAASRPPQPERDERSAPAATVPVAGGREREPQGALAEPAREPERPLADRAPADAPAAPSVRRLARELGIDINDVRGQGPGGRIAVDDVMRHARELIRGRLAGPRGAPAPAAPVAELPDFTRFGPVERQPMSGVRRKTAQSVARSWLAIPHVTQFDRADVTELEEARKLYAPRVQAAGSRLTLTAVIIKALAAALKGFPKFNASLDVERDEIILKQYVNIGVAVDTEHGLLVPVIRDADQKSVVEIGRDLTQLSERARARKSRPDDLQGSNFTVTNLGGLGTTYFSPLVNWPEVAVLGVGRAGLEAVYRDHAFIPRLILPLSISYDHRLIDGADAARFLRGIAEALEHPLALALDG